MSAAVGPGRERLRSVDVLRGVVMVIMALDHVRDFFSGVPFEPTDLSKTWPALFFTRWITHFCAPVFVFLAGTGTYLSLAGGRPKPEVARFLVTRGLWLVLLELTVVRFGWNLDVTAPFVLLQVIWAIGVSMIALGALVFLPLRAVLAIGLAMIVGHDLMDPLDGRIALSLGATWTLLHVAGPLPAIGPLEPFVGYPLIPWIGVMAVGYAFGAALRADAAVRRRRLVWLGGATCALFVALRAANVYGDPRPWSPQASGLFTLLSFVDCSKYPPSLLYLSMTLGPALLALAALDRTKGEGLARPLLVFGRVPLFYYLVHIIVIHLVVMVMGALHFGHVVWDLAADPFEPKPEGWGYSLSVVYGLWAAIVAALYPLCAWFEGVKRRAGEDRTPASRWLRFL